ncbi:MAG: SDR family NAD(P)-dependent oxidoreductase, partial [Thermoplasmata archaeon]|nr:SDR family NAD(P)-dependent oxidoreductase [Thermoplasmata archaeon]
MESSTPAGTRAAAAKVALITGASRGLGRVLATFLAKQGFVLVITARTETELADAAKELTPYGSPVTSIPGDVKDAKHRGRLVAAAGRWGRIDVLVNNASDLGTSPLPAIIDVPREDLLRVFDANVLAPLALVQEAMPLLARSGGLV